jgi:hypothetical protein
MNGPSHTDRLRAQLIAMPGTQEQKAVAIGVGLSWLQKFLDGRIKQPRSDRYEILRAYVSGPSPSGTREAA